MMNVKMVGKELKVTEAIEAYVTEKMKRIEKYFEEEMEVAVTIKAQREEQIASIVVKVTGATFIAETSHKDLYASIAVSYTHLDVYKRQLLNKVHFRIIIQSHI